MMRVIELAVPPVTPLDANDRREEWRAATALLLAYLLASGGEDVRSDGRRTRGATASTSRSPRAGDRARGIRPPRSC